jgi:hypothetical protein
MRFSAVFIGFTAAACLTLSPAYADSRAPHGNKPSTPGKPTMSTPSSSAKPGKSPKSSTPTTNGSSTTSTTSASPTNTSTPTTQLNPIATKIASKPALNAKISAMLPTVKGKTMSLNDASMGFKNQGQFIAALHVSQNLNIPFMDLKNAMVTKTGTGATAEFNQTSSLGQAIQTVKKNASATTEVEKAEQQTNADLTNTTTTSSTKPAKNKKKTTTQTGGNQ